MMSSPCRSPATQYLCKRQNLVLHGDSLIPFIYKDVSGKSHWSLGHNNMHLFSSAQHEEIPSQDLCGALAFRGHCSNPYSSPMSVPREMRVEVNTIWGTMITDNIPSTLENLSAGDIYDQVFSEFPFEESSQILKITFLIPVNTGQKKTVRARSSLWPLITNRYVN